MIALNKGVSIYVGLGLFADRFGVQVGGLARFFGPTWQSYISALKGRGTVKRLFMER